MENKKINKLRGGIENLFPDKNQEQPAEIAEPQEQPAGEDSDIIEAIENEELKEALKERRQRNSGRPKKNDPSAKASAGYQRITNIVNIEKMEKIREISFRESLTIKEVLDAVLDLAIAKYEETHGEIKKHRKKSSSNLFGE